MTQTTINVALPEAVFAKAGAQLDAMNVTEKQQVRCSDGKYYVDDLLPGDPDVSALAVWCDENLIRENGQPDGAAIDAVARHGFVVRPGEQDSFGWLTGVLSAYGIHYVYG